MILMPSTAESTESAGVMIASPKKRPPLMIPKSMMRDARPRMALLASAISARVPPSPWLSVRSKMTIYFSVTTSRSAQMTSESMPSTTSWLAGLPRPTAAMTDSLNA
jgi:hypothetical protein